VAVGEAGLILTSPDGVTWTRRTSGTTVWLNSVCYSDGTYYAVGSGGTILGSPDAVTWSLLPVSTTKSLYALASFNGQVLAAGVEGAVLRARVTPLATLVNFLSFARDAAAEVFLFSGELDQRFMLEKSQDLPTWMDGPEIEMLDDSGSQLFYQSVGRATDLIFQDPVIASLDGPTDFVIRARSATVINFSGRRQNKAR